MSVNSRAKGAAAEREVCEILRAAGWPGARRSSDGRAQAERGDIVRGPAGFHLECKRRERILLVEWSMRRDLAEGAGTVAVPPESAMETFGGRRAA